MSEIESKVKAIIVDKLGVDEAEVKPEASFTNDLGADSLDTVELIMEFEFSTIFETIKGFFEANVLPTLKPIIDAIMGLIGGIIGGK